MPEWEELSATACSVQNIYLMAHALGIGGGPSAFCPIPTGLQAVAGCFTCCMLLSSLPELVPLWPVNLWQLALHTRPGAGLPALGGKWLH